ncbi:MAG: 2-oxoacid:acceptor oxidoreductase subunit alpha [Planctomycetaceae bacterium]|nr:2-oxoglutarate oxidoreductase subunit KorA [Planctomycetota bacterium]MCQ3949237.1 2-oxoacid:acceptor oxidoreductase subunit alpha [Planctomycetota bacterium]NUO15882.1 2-oxoacid:acceptor oxidoreductase subunit alpha [Planctomycetaceae bacterium]GIK52688.1 MAG: pyruvate ferredoxin oxidoreductase [Planctomycetota bacterium]HRJ78231.1 2-oxoacid:acceptor oxidoreductase subunit alpha [Planctomycetota bacterium]
MSTATAAPPAQQTRVINDFSFHVATANGSGSQTANMVLLRGLFKMGIPVSGKNLFPSNIQGLPTWFTIRVNKDGWIGRATTPDIIICMNPESAIEDVETARKGAVLIYDDSLGLSKMRPDCIHYPVPFKKLVVDACPDLKLRKLVINMLYVGVCSALFNIAEDKLMSALSAQLKTKPKAVKVNEPAITLGRKWALENIKKVDPFWCEPLNKNGGKIIIEGNAATALGLMFNGCTVASWYPITPSSSLCESLEDYMRDYRVNPDGKRTFAVIQAEDEIAAVGMLAGAGWAGARCFTSTSGPGISLMNEIIGLGYFAEIPFVICNVARTGPSTGLPTRTMQGDILNVIYASHGDTKHVVIFPSNPKEAFEFAGVALDLAEQLQTPVFINSDLDLGMNYWMSDRFDYPTGPVKRGKVLHKADLEKLKGQWARYRDVDGDGIGYRTLPGTDHPNAAYFTRGTGHTEMATYSEKATDWKKNMDRLTRKFETAKTLVPKPVIDGYTNRVGILYFGTTESAVREAASLLEKQHGHKVDLCRVRAFPFSREVEDFLATHERVYVVEMNRDAQMAMVIRAELPRFAMTLRSILHYDGLPLTAGVVVEQFLAQHKDEPNPTKIAQSASHATAALGTKGRD